MPPRIIPLEPVADGPEGPVALTDVVLALYLEGLPSHSHEDEQMAFESGPLGESAIAAFALGCAVGVDFPDHVSLILGQTHPGAVEQIIEECRVPLAQRAAAVRESLEPLEPEDFLDDLLQALEQEDHVDSNAAHNALSVSFEYGCILAHVQRSAAMVVRNAFNQAQEESVREFEAGETEDLPPGPDPCHALQELAQELISAYEADIGF